MVRMREKSGIKLDKVCIHCEKPYRSYYVGSLFCSNECRHEFWETNKKTHDGKVNKRLLCQLPTRHFVQSMAMYNSEEIAIAYKAFKSWKPLLSVVKCKCRGEFMCYPHQLERLRAVHLHGQKFLLE